MQLRNRIVGLLAFGAFSLLSLAAFPSTAFSPYAAVVELDTPGGGHGSAVFIDATHLLTAHHVIAGPGKYTVAIDGFAVPVNVVFDDADEDVAVVQLDKSFPMTSAAIAQVACKVPEIGAPISIIGSPGELGIVTTWGRVSSGVRTIQKTADMYAIDATITHGSSGGPVFDADGNIVGIVLQTGGVILQTMQGDMFMSDFPMAIAKDPSVICADLHKWGLRT